MISTISVEYLIHQAAQVHHEPGAVRHHLPHFVGPELQHPHGQVAPVHQELLDLRAVVAPRQDVFLGQGLAVEKAGHVVLVGLVIGGKARVGAGKARRRLVDNRPVPIAHVDGQVPVMLRCGQDRPVPALQLPAVDQARVRPGDMCACSAAEADLTAAPPSG